MTTNVFYVGRLCVAGRYESSEFSSKLIRCVSLADGKLAYSQCMQLSDDLVTARWFDMDGEDRNVTLELAVLGRKPVWRQVTGLASEPRELVGEGSFEKDRLQVGDAGQELPNGLRGTRIADKSDCRSVIFYNVPKAWDDVIELQGRDPQSVQGEAVARLHESVVEKGRLLLGEPKQIGPDNFVEKMFGQDLSGEFTSIKGRADRASNVNVLEEDRQ